MKFFGDTGLRAYLGLPDHRHRQQLFSDEHFQYDPLADHYICSAGETLPRSSYDRQRDMYMYRTSAKICQACPLKAQCTTSSYARIVTRSPHQAYLDRVRTYHATPAYEKAQRKRSVWVEPMFGEAKMWHNLRRFRLRGLVKVNIQALRTTAGQNIKRLLKHKPLKYHPNPPLAQPLPNWPTLMMVLNNLLHSLSTSQSRLFQHAGLKTYTKSNCVILHNLATLIYVYKINATLHTLKVIMRPFRLSTSLLIVGIALILIAAWMFYPRKAITRPRTQLPSACWV